MSLPAVKTSCFFILCAFQKNPLETIAKPTRRHKRRYFRSGELVGGIRIRLQRIKGPFFLAVAGFSEKVLTHQHPASAIYETVDSSYERLGDVHQKPSVPQESWHSGLTRITPTSSPHHTCWRLGKSWRVLALLLIQRLSKCHDSAGRVPVASPQDCQVPFAGDVFISRSATSRRFFHFRREKDRQMANCHKENSLDSMNAFSFFSPPQRPHQKISGHWPSQTSRLHEGEFVRLCLFEPYVISWVFSLFLFFYINSSRTGKDSAEWLHVVLIIYM